MRRSTLLRLFAALFALALVAAACGDSDDDDADDTEAPAETTAAESETETTEAADGGDEMPATVVDLAVGAGDFTTLVAAVEAAGLVETLSGEGPFTVFAPTDDAFAALPEGTIDALLEDTDTLAEILTYHVVAGEVLAADVVGLEEAETVQGDTIDISVDGETVMVDGATVVTTDLMAGNGVVHVIDAVILPDGVEIP